jgi:hypothetical protein
MVKANQRLASESLSARAASNGPLSRRRHPEQWSASSRAPSTMPLALAPRPSWRRAAPCFWPYQ